MANKFEAEAQEHLKVKDVIDRALPEGNVISSKLVASCLNADDQLETDTKAGGCT